MNSLDNSSRIGSVDSMESAATFLTVVLDLANFEEVTGLGDVVEGVLIRFGVTEERFKKWFNLRECNCSKRKQWLNKIFSWKKSKKGESGD